MKVEILGRKRKVEQKKCRPPRWLLGIIITVMIRTIVFGAAITAAMVPSSGSAPASTILNHLSRFRRNNDPTNATHPVPGNDSQAVVADATDPQLTIQRAKQQLLETSKHRVTLHNEKEPIHIWAEQVVGVTINRDLGTLEDKLKLSITHLEFGKVSMARCLSLWGPEHSSWAKGLCEDAILGINNRWRATTEPILNAF